jgi:hypothetical protein
LQATLPRRAGVRLDSLGLYFGSPPLVDKNEK